MNRFTAPLTGLCLLAAAASAQNIATQVVASGLTRPVYVAAPPGDTGRLFVVESRFRATTSDPWSGRIKIINLATNTVNATPFLTFTPTGGVASAVTTDYITEQGLLGVAFHPNYAQNGYFYIHHTRGSDYAVIIARMRANAPYATSGTADPASYTPLMTIAHPQTNHNGGWIAFGPDGNLYFSVGDGGNGNDTGTGHSAGGNAQDLTKNLGKINRIDVDGPDNIPGNADDADTAAGTPYRIPAGNPFTGAGQRKEIWAYGLRNPYRSSFDRQTGDLWIGDVGQDAREEIDVAIGNPAGRNYGWKCQEGFLCTGLANCPTCPALPGGVTPPIADYSHTTPVIAPFNFTGCAIIGGYVYRGCAMPFLRGSYFFTDNCNPIIYSIRSNGTSVTEAINRTTQLDPPGTATFVAISAFGEDASGEMYIVDQPATNAGVVYKIIPAQATTRCSSCGPADFNGDGDIGTDQDIEAFFRCLSGNCCATCFSGGADFNGDGDIGTDQDIEAFFRVLAGGSC